MPGLLLIGADHRIAPSDVRKKLPVSQAEMGNVLGRLRSSAHIREVFLLSAPRQTEIYLRGQSSALDDIRLFWQERAGAPLEDLVSSLYEKKDADAAYHLFALGAGVSPSAAGNGDLLPGIQASLAAAREAGTLEGYLDALLSRTLRVARRVRRQMGLEPAPMLPQEAQAALQQEADRFIRWARSRRATSAINSMKRRAEQIRQSELQKLESKLRHLSPEEREALEALTVSIVNKLLRPSKKALKEAAGLSDATDYLQAASELFDIDDP